MHGSGEGISDGVLDMNNGCNEWKVLGFELYLANGATEGFDECLPVGRLLGRGEEDSKRMNK